eukprot:5852902-Pleurochrysis_carterae.AAC.3
MHGLYRHLRDDPDPTVLVCPLPCMSRQLQRWQTRLSNSNYTPLLAVATPQPQPSRVPCSAPTLFLSMDAAKADLQGEVLGLRCYCHGLFFSLPLSTNMRRANSIATLERMALVAAVATFLDFSATSLASFLSRTRSLLLSTCWRMTKQRTRQRSVHLSICMPCLLFLPPSCASTCATSLARPIPWLMNAAAAAFRSCMPSARGLTCTRSAYKCRLMLPLSSASLYQGTEPSTSICFLWRVTSKSNRALPGGSLPLRMRCMTHTR